MTKVHPVPSKKAKALLTNGKVKLTPFQIKVYEAICQVPKGKATTYKYLANAIGCRSSQAVGQALKRNPYAPTIPCHRVVQSNMKLGGFGGCRVGDKINKKKHLLTSEGIDFLENGNIDPTYIFKF
jgi:methylated-DNA-[protein]-cysteine S-methyltransferase